MKVIHTPYVSSRWMNTCSCCWTHAPCSCPWSHPTAVGRIHAYAPSIRNSEAPPYRWPQLTRRQFMQIIGDARHCYGRPVVLAFASCECTHEKGIQITDDRSERRNIRTCIVIKNKKNVGACMGDTLVPYYNFLYIQDEKKNEPPL